MISEKHEGWIDILGEEKSKWLPKFCVVDRKQNAIQIYQDEKSYFEHIDAFFIKPDFARQREAWESKQQDAAKKKRRSQSLVPSSSPLLPPRRLTDLPRKIAQGLRAYRTRSVSSYDEIPDEPNEKSLRSLSHGHLQISRSQESLLNATAAKTATHTVESLDMSVSGKVTVRPIHPSILHRQHCFQVTSPHEVKYFSCRSAQELNKWVNSIKKSLQPTRDQQSRTDVSMNVWIFEAKGMVTKPKKKYYCELLLDKMLYARTTRKTKSDTLFWGENFSFEDLPDLSTITVNIYKDTEGKNKKEKRKLVGTVNIAAESLDTSQGVEKWYPIVMATNKGNAGDGAPSIRLKIRFQKIHILPLDVYRDMLSYLSNNYMLLCETLESSVSSKVKDEIAGVILRVLQPVGKAQEFLVSIVMEEVNKLGTGDENLVFRGNSFATKAMDTYMKMVGESYLQDTLGDFVLSVYDMAEDCEVDASKVLNGNIQSNQENLKAFAEKAWNHILCSSCLFPSDLQETFHQFRQRCVNGSKDLSPKLISASIFLRFLCPAIMSPSLFHLMQEYPNEKTLRTLTLIAKVIQNLANFTQFGGKEEYMGFMNGFVENEFDKMREFVNIISSPPSGHGNRYEDSIDHGRELALLYTILKDQLTKLDKESLDKLRQLQFTLKSLQEMYHDAETAPNDSEKAPNDSDTFFVPPRKWASSSDLVSDQEREKITLTPVTQMKLTKTQTKDLQSSLPSEIWKKNVKRGSRALPTPQHLIVSPEDILASSPFDFESRRYSLPITRGGTDEEDLSSTSSSGTLRRYSYLNAMESDDNFSTERKSPDSNGIAGKRYDKRNGQNGDFMHSYQALATHQTRLAVQRDLSLSFSNLESPSKEKARQRPWSMILEPSNGFKVPGSPKMIRPHTPPVITDHSRSSSGTNISKSSSTTSSLAIIDSITRVQQIDRDTDHSSPTSSPIMRRRSPNHSPKLLRVRKDPSEMLTRVARTPSATSSSSSESSGSWQSSSFGSGGTDVSGMDRIRRRQHKLPFTPVDTPRRGSGSTTGSDRLLSRADDDFRDENLNITPRQKFGNEPEKDASELTHELTETKRTLASTHEQLILQESSTHKLVASFKERLAESEQNLRTTREDKDNEVKELLDRLLSVENELAKERKEMQDVVQAKQRIIEAQERRIRSMETTNTRLVATLNQMKAKQDKHMQQQKDNPSVIDSD